MADKCKQILFPHFFYCDCWYQKASNAFQGSTDENEWRNWPFQSFSNSYRNSTSRVILLILDVVSVDYDC